MHRAERDVGGTRLAIEAESDRCDALLLLADR
jgi:hypothetical protein